MMSYKKKKKTTVETNKNKTAQPRVVMNDVLNPEEKESEKKAKGKVERINKKKYVTIDPENDLHHFRRSYF